MKKAKKKKIQKKSQKAIKILKGLKIDYVECVCNGPEHTIKVIYMDDEELSLNIFLNSGNFIDRLVQGIGYIFGHKSRYGHFDEVLLNHENAQKFIKVLKILKKPKKRVDKSKTF